MSRRTGWALGVVLSVAAAGTLHAWSPYPGHFEREEAPPAPVALCSSHRASAAAAGDEEFKSKISPLLMSRCSPCHAPGGKMYERIPFDEEKAVRDHKDGVLRRLKGEDKETVEAWLARGH